jgi:hypothetical protein
MAEHVIGERRREPRRPGAAHAAATEPQVPGARVIDVLDVSAHGLRCRLAHPVRPGRTMPLRLPGAGVVQAQVVRCEVSRLSRSGVQYDAAWTLDRPWAPE